MTKKAILNIFNSIINYFWHQILVRILGMTLQKLLFPLLLFPLLASAQINESDSLKVKASLALTGFYQGGNVETLIFRANSHFSFKPWEKAVFKTQNSYVYQAFDKDKADEDILSLNFLYFNPERKIYPQVLGFLSTNFRREIDMRYLVGGGVTFQVIQKEKHWLKFSLTSEYEHTEFKSATFNRPEYNGDSTVNTWRGTIWINGKYHLFEGKLIFGHESFFQPSLEDFNNYRWRTDLSLELPVWKFLNFKINYLRTSESLVIIDQKRKDSLVSFGLTIKNF